MKNEKNPLIITEISLEDFKKLNLIGHEHRTHWYNRDTNKEIKYDETGEWVEDSKGGKHWVCFQNVYSKIEWDTVYLNDLVEENIELSKKEGWTGSICVAIHKEYSENDLDKNNKWFYDNAIDDCKKGMLLLASSYLDKWLTRSGNQSYLLRCDVEHLYSRRNYFYTKDDYFDVPKNETKAIYLIHWN